MYRGIHIKHFQALHPKFKGLYQQNMAKNMVLTYLHLGSWNSYWIDSSHPLIGHSYGQWSIDDLSMNLVSTSKNLPGTYRGPKRKINFAHWIPSSFSLKINVCLFHPVTTMLNTSQTIVLFLALDLFRNLGPSFRWYLICFNMICGKYNFSFPPTIMFFTISQCISSPKITIFDDDFFLKSPTPTMAQKPAPLVPRGLWPLQFPSSPRSEQTPRDFCGWHDEGISCRFSGELMSTLGEDKPWFNSG